MEALGHFLPQVWFVILGLFLFLYVMLDGFDWGVGILSLTSSDEERRSILMTSLGNIWEGACHFLERKIRLERQQ
jgi:cytochrome bd ubiquinol oxidase subunit II